MKSAAGEKPQEFDSQKEKSTSSRKDQNKLQRCTALQTQYATRHLAALTGMQTPRMCLSLSARTEHLDFFFQTSSVGL